MALISRLGGFSAAASSLLVLVGACSDDVEKPSKSTTTLIGPDGGPLRTCPSQVGTQFPRTPFRPPKPMRQRKCTETQAKAVVVCYVLDGAQSAECQQFVRDTANAECITCAVSPTTDASYGPILYDAVQGKVSSLNFAGCVAQTGQDPSPTGCGQKYGELFDCQVAACACATNSYYQDCSYAATQTVCSKYQTPCATPQALAQCEGVGPSYWVGNAAQRALDLVKIWCT